MFGGLLFIKVENTVMWTHCGVWGCSFSHYLRRSWSCLKFVHISYKKVSRNDMVSRLMAWEIGVRQLLLHMWQPLGICCLDIHIELSVPPSLSHTIRIATGPYSLQKIADSCSETKKNFFSFLSFFCSNVFNLFFTLCKCWSIHLRYPTW